MAAAVQVPAAAIFSRGITASASTDTSAPHPPPTAAQLSAIFVMKEWKLSPREKSCLRWVSQGRPLVEIASLEGKSIAEVEACLERALVTLEARSIMEALEKANLFEPD